MSTQTQTGDSATRAMIMARRIEWPTILLIVAVYAVIGLLVWFHASLPWWLILILGAPTACLHSSLQHEVLHGHPTRNRTLNEFMVWLTPTFWMPYQRYRETHLTHHNDAHLTDPELDPESYYDLPETWARRGGWQRTIFTFNHTLLGRMTIGPAVGIIRFWGSELWSIYKGDHTKIGCWALFFASIATSIYFICFVAGMPLWKYYVLVAYPGISLALVRSYCEHQAVPHVGERTIVVEASSFWSLLFLNNNLHIAHHEVPSLAWYELPAYYRRNRERLLSKNKHYLMNGYGEIFSKFFLRAKEPIPYPDVAWLKR
jgi:fatty acid desaturase